MCFVTVNTFRPKPNTPAETEKQRVESDKRLAQKIDHIMNHTSIGSSLRMLSDHARPKSMFERMTEDEIK